MQRFSNYASKRLRRSQVKVLYQNQEAASYLLEELSPARELGDHSQKALIEDLLFVKMVTENAIIGLTYQDVLSELDSQELLKTNKGLRNIYSGFLEGKRAAKAAFGQSSAELMPFEKRFMPAAGWNNISDTEWNRMVSKAIEGLPK